MGRRMLLMTEGVGDAVRAKTAVALLRYCGDEVVAVLDSQRVGQTADGVFGFGGDTPIVGSVADGEAAGGTTGVDQLVVGVATSGGRLPVPMREHVKEALRRGLCVVSGLHEFLGEDEEFRGLAAEFGGWIWDVRKNSEREVANRIGLDEGCLRVHTVGHDCSCGKMVTAVELARAMKGAALDAKFVATGQTGIMVEGDGCPIDCVVADFINGAAERLVLNNQHHDVLVVEGQGTLAHPRYSSVTMGLLHGCAAEGLIMCFEHGRERMHNMEHVGLRPLRELISFYEEAARIGGVEARVIGLAMNGRRLGESEAEGVRKGYENEFGLPVCDPVRDGVGALVEAVLGFAKERGKRVVERKMKEVSP